jgi:hypothetical protein
LLVKGSGFLPRSRFDLWRLRDLDDRRLECPREGERGLGGGGGGVFPGVRWCTPGEGGPGDLPLSGVGLRDLGGGVVIVKRSNGDGKGLASGRGDVIPSDEDASRDKGNNVNLDFTEKELKTFLKSPKVVQGVEGSRKYYQ